MAKNKLYDSRTWRMTLPEPFHLTVNGTSTIHYSRYNMASAKKATLHSPTLSAILAYLDMDTTYTPASTSACAIGTQGDKIVAEYRSRTKEIHAVVFNKKNGKFNVGRFEDPTAAPKVYSLKDGGNTGTALFFALIPEALTEDEFREYYELLGRCKNDGFSDMEEAEKAAFILCDNLYRRIEGANLHGKNGIDLDIPATGNIAPITTLNLNKKAYSPSSVLYGTFEIFTGTAVLTAGTAVDKKDFIGNYPLSNRMFSAQEQLMIPKIEDWYLIPQEVVTICKHAFLTTNSSQPMRNFMMRGPAGTGKTEGAKAIAAGLGLPYLYYTCSANTEIYDFLGQMLPETDGKQEMVAEYPSFTDIQMDPPSAYKKLTGIYDEEVTDVEVFNKLMEVMERDAKTLVNDNAGGQKFRYVETPLIQAIRNGYLIEIQEPTVIANPGVLVGLNALLDRCASITLTTGEVIHRHPDTVVVITTNNSYAGCRDMNQSVISRMNLILDVETPDVGTLAERTMLVTGCTDKTMVTDMAAAVQEISERCRETMINDGSCGVRELISWVQSYMVCGNALEAAKYTVLSSVSSDPENRADILSSCLEQKFAA
ncbi:MAG: AAA family ATPase [Lachnospiraceae bacterium]|nr:AAA family ATPase [Lachnospiraceae bacterium]